MGKMWIRPWAIFAQYVDRAFDEFFAKKVLNINRLRHSACSSWNLLRIECHVKYGCAKLFIPICLTGTFNAKVNAGAEPKFSRGKR